MLLHSWQGECAGSAVLRAFKGGDFKRDPREGSYWIFISFPGVSFKGVVSTD